MRPRLTLETITTTYGYDNADRPTTRTYSDGTPAITNVYDANGFTGLKTSMTDQIGSVTWTYDQVNQMTVSVR